MRFRGRPKTRIARIRRALIVWPTMVGYLVMALGIPIPIRAADPSRPLPVQSGSCRCGKCDHGKKKCCCCCAVESDDHAPPKPVSVSSTPSSPKTDRGRADAIKAVVWQLYVTAPSCNEQAKLWLTDNPASIVPLQWTCPVALVPFGWLQPIDCTASALTISPPSPPPRV
jgi:hypothetical protein